jgi:hypothetical protein
MGHGLMVMCADCTCMRDRYEGEEVEEGEDKHGYEKSKGEREGHKQKQRANLNLDGGKEMRRPTTSSHKEVEETRFAQWGEVDDLDGTDERII